MEYSPDLIRTKFKSLPPELQDAVTSTKADMLLHAIAHDNGIDEAKYGAFTTHAFVYLIGISSAADFGAGLETIGITKESAGKIVGEVDTKVKQRLASLSLDDGVDEELARTYEKDLPKLLAPAQSAEMKNDGLSLLDDKLSGVVKSAHEDPTPQPAAPAPEPKPEPPKRIYSDGTDPYREPFS